MDLSIKETIKENSRIIAMQVQSHLDMDVDIDVGEIRLRCDNLNKNEKNINFISPKRICRWSVEWFFGNHNSPTEANF